MAWLSGWDKRIKLDISDYANDIGASVTWFPVTVFLTSTQGEEVFVELTTDAEFPKVAFTKADGETELYGECELFDVSEELAIYHVSRDGWTINANTSIYMYYDADHADNNTYIGAITARTEVWDGNFEAVYHMVDDNGNVDDSTSNNVDLTKASAGNPAEVAGKVGQGQDFSSDYMTHATFLDSMPDDLTIEMCIKLDTIDRSHYLFLKSNIYDEDRIAFDINSTNHIEFWGEAQNGGPKTALSTGTVTTATWYYVAGVHTHDAALKVYLDTAEDTGDTLGNILDGTYSDIAIGDTRISSPQYPVDGIMDELRFSGTPRTAAWLKGTYNSLWDTLLTYGSEEISGETHKLSGTAVCAISTVGTINITSSLMGTSVNDITTSSTLNLKYHIAGTSASYVNAVAGYLRVIYSYSGTSANVISTVGGSLDIFKRLSGTSVNVVSTVGGLNIILSLTGVSTSTMSTVGTINIILDIKGTSINILSTTGALGITLPLSGTSENVISTLSDFLNNISVLQGTSNNVISTIAPELIAARIQKLTGISVNVFSTSGIIGLIHYLLGLSPNVISTVGDELFLNVSWWSRTGKGSSSMAETGKGSSSWTEIKK